MTLGSEEVSPKGKRKAQQEEDEDYGEFPQKKHKLYGKGGSVVDIFSQESLDLILGR